jgi:hypothetical protein
LGDSLPHRDDRFQGSVLEPEPNSRRLWAGCRTGRRQAPPVLVPGKLQRPGFDIDYGVSTRHRRFTCVRLFGSYLTRSSRAFSEDASHDGSLPTQLLGGLRPGPATRSREVNSHLMHSFSLHTAVAPLVRQAPQFLPRLRPPSGKISPPSSADHGDGPLLTYRNPFSASPPTKADAGPDEDLDISDL